MTLLRTLALVLAAAFALALAGCGKHEPPPPKPVPAGAKAAPKPAPKPQPPAAPPAPPAPPAFHVTGVTLGTMIDDAYLVTVPATQLPASIPAIYASVATDGTATGATLGARWSYLEGKGLLITETTQPVTAEGPATTAFKLANPNRWPLGKYQVEITLDGKVVATQAFEVVAKK